MKKPIATLLALVLCLLCFAGCGDMYKKAPETALSPATLGPGTNTNK